MSEHTQLPEPDKLCDKEIFAALHAAGKEDERAVRRLFTEPALALAARVERIVADNPDTIRDVAAQVPIFDLPYYSIPPDAKLPIPDPAQIEPYTKAYVAYRDETFFPDSNLPEFRYALADPRNRPVQGDHWNQYQRTCQTLKQIGYPLSRIILTGFHRYNTTRDIHHIEQHFFDHHLTKQHPDSLFRLTAPFKKNNGYPIRTPVYEGMAIDAERLTQATGILVDLIHVDPYFQKTAESIEQNDQMLRLLLKRTLRAHDYDAPTEVMKRSVIESIVRAVLPMVVECSRYDNPRQEDAFARSTANDMPTKITRLAPLGYSGPAAIYGVALANQTSTVDTDGNQQFTPETIERLNTMANYVNRHFHYPNLLAQNKALITGERPPQMLRTGLKCPVRIHDELPSPISALTETIFMIYDILKGSQSAAVASPNPSPYIFDFHREYAWNLYDKSPGLQNVSGQDYKGLGRIAARNALNTAASLHVG